MTVLAGVDGFKNGWVVVECRLPERAFAWKPFFNFNELLAPSANYQIIAVDIPIGLLKTAQPGGRGCDKEARALLKAPRASSVFSPPVRQVLNCSGFEAACRVNRASSSHAVGISRQCFGLCSKIAKVDEILRSSPGLQGRIDLRKNVRPIAGKVFEVHPELCFMQMASRPMAFSKKKRAGRNEREKEIASVIPSLESLIREFRAQPRQGVGEDDLLDACVACWTALRIYDVCALAIPESGPADEKGLLMQMWR